MTLGGTFRCAQLWDQPVNSSEHLEELAVPGSTQLNSLLVALSYVLCLRQRISREKSLEKDRCTAGNAIDLAKAIPLPPLVRFFEITMAAVTLQSCAGRLGQGLRLALVGALLLRLMSLIFPFS